MTKKGRTNKISEEQKEKKELEVFLAFAEQCLLNIDLGSASNEKEPRPDISCTIDGQTHYFELGRIVDEGLRQRLSYSLKTGNNTGGPFSQDIPPVKIVQKKASKIYEGALKESLDLLIYYDEQVPLIEALRPVTKHTLFWAAHDMTVLGRYNRIWFYSHCTRQIFDVYPPLVGVPHGNVFSAVIEGVSEEPKMMTELERHQLKAKLIEFGFWEESRSDDPTRDYSSAAVVHLCAEERLTKNAFLASFGFSMDSKVRRLMLVYDESRYPLAIGESYTEAVCQAAIALPDFLEQHPECARQN